MQYGNLQAGLNLYLDARYVFGSTDHYQNRFALWHTRPFLDF